jgi:hypothetical protein
MMRKEIELLLIFFLMPVSVFSQYCLQGKVMNEKGTGIDGAQIYLYQNGELAALAHSDTKGEYRTGKVPLGKYHVVASCLGFISKEDSMTIAQDVTMNFTLETRSIMLDDIVVNGRSSHATSKGHIFYLSKEAKECGNPFVALQEIPLLYSDPVNESVRSSDGQPMAILIDGMRVNSGISPIDPSRIKSVEILEVVGAKYMRQGVKRVMNIKLKKTSLYTYAQLSARADYPEKSGFAMPKFEIGNSNISLYGDASFGTSHSRQANSYKLITPMLIKGYSGELKGKSTDYDYSLMTKWHITGKDYLAAYIQGNGSKETNRNMSIGEQNEHSITRDNTSDYRSHLFSSTAYYKHVFSKDEEMEAYAVYSDNRADNTNSLEENVNGNVGVNTQKYNNQHKLMTFTLDYSKDFDNGGSLNIGNETQYSYDRIENTGIGNYLFGHHRLNEFIFAGYSGMLARKLTYDVTAGMEYMSMKSDSIYHHYFKPRLSLGMYYNITNNISTKISYSYSNTPPSVAMLNPYNTSADTLLVSHGNPFLMPSNTHSFGWNASYFRGGLCLSTSMSYGISSDIVEPVHSAEDNGVLLTTYGNMGHFRSLQMKYFMSWRIKGFFLLMDMAHNVSYYTTVGAKKHFTSMLIFSKKWGKFEARTTFYYQNYINTEFSRTKNYNPTSSLTLSYSFTPDILLSVGCTSFIGNPRSKTTVSIDSYKSVTYSTQKTFTPWILFRWSIRKNDKKKIELENDIIRDHEGKIKL